MNRSFIKCAETFARRFFGVFYRTRRVLIISMAIAVFLIGQGCMTLTNLHTARPLSPGEAELSFAGEGVGVTAEGITALVPTAEAQLRYGVNERMDFGVKLFPPGLFADLNILLLDASPLVISIDPGFSFAFLSTGDISILTLQGWLPILIDVEVAKKLTLTLGPRVGAQYFKQIYNQEMYGGPSPEDEIIWLVGGTGMAKINLAKRLCLILEMSAYMPTEGGEIMFNPAVALGIAL